MANPFSFVDATKPLKGLKSLKDVTIVLFYKLKLYYIRLDKNIYDCHKLKYTEDMQWNSVGFSLIKNKYSWKDKRYVLFNTGFDYYMDKAVDLDKTVLHLNDVVIFIASEAWGDVSGCWQIGQKKRKLSDHCHIWPGVIGLCWQKGSQLELLLRYVVCECTKVIQAEQRQCPSLLVDALLIAQE